MIKIHYETSDGMIFGDGTDLDLAKEKTAEINKRNGRHAKVRSCLVDAILPNADYISEYYDAGLVR